MKRGRAFWALLALLAWAPLLRAEPVSDPVGWLGRISSAAQRLNYTGTFIYQSGPLMETSRIMHGVDGQGEFERLEVLDGSPREVVRSNGEVRCVLPQERIVIIDQQGGRRPFPARLQASFASLAENYTVRKGEVGRIAGHEAQQLILQPKDNLRFGHLLWADTESGLLLKARMVDGRGGVIEQFSFSEIHIGAPADRKGLPATKADGGWRVVDARGVEVGDAEAGWVVRDMLPGFRRVSMVRRTFGDAREPSLHMMFSDGMANISVFIEPTGVGGRTGARIGAAGPISIYERIVEGGRITVLGAVPELALQRLGDGIERAR